MRALLATTAVIEGATGIALLAVPARLASILLGATLDPPAGLVVARLAGASLLSLGVVCWSGSRYTQIRAATGIIVAMLLYNLAAVVADKGNEHRFRVTSKYPPSPRRPVEL